MFQTMDLALTQLISWPKLHSLCELAAIKDRSFVVDPLLHFSAAEWDDNRDVIIGRIALSNLGDHVAVRSAGCHEDRPHDVPPGFFVSVLNVSRHDSVALAAAVDAVRNSYRRPDRPSHPNIPDRVMVQTYVRNSLLAGIARIEHPLGHYASIEYDNTRGTTDGVTSGRDITRVQLFLEPGVHDATWAALVQAIVEIAHAQPRDAFIEFCLDAEHKVHIFQTRLDHRKGVARGPPLPPVDRPALTKRLRGHASAVARQVPVSRMTDWNPAEILGPHPSCLAVSLYQAVVTDSAWAHGRAAAGWHLPPDTRLLCNVANTPFVRVPISFKSLLPATLPPELADRIARDRIALLEERPHLHDKVEFRIMWSAYDFGADKTINELPMRGFSATDVLTVREALLLLTKQAVANFDAWDREDNAGIAIIEGTRAQLQAKLDRCSGIRDAIPLIHGALRICATSGAAPFSRQARLAFMFRYMLSCLVRTGALDDAWVTSFLASVDTVATALVQELSKAKAHPDGRAEFYRRYGHLRSSTYEILSPRYDEMAELPGPTHQSAAAPKSVPPPQAPNALDEFLAISGLVLSADAFLGFGRRAIQNREAIKLSFTALLSDALRALALQSKAVGLPIQDVAQLPLPRIVEICRESVDDSNAVHHLRQEAEESRKLQELDRVIALPDIVFRPHDLYLVPKIKTVPTFIGLTSVSAPPVTMPDAPTNQQGRLRGAILIARSLEPGADWIFSEQIAGLITAFGGEFSHMAVRCSEFGIPAALGCGEDACSTLSNAAVVTVDPSSNTICADGQPIIRNPIP